MRSVQSDGPAGPQYQIIRFNPNDKRGEAEPEDLSNNLIVQLGMVTEVLNRAWY